MPKYSVKPKSNTRYSVKILDTVHRQLDEVSRWGGEFYVERTGTDKLEIVFNDGHRATIKANDTTGKAAEGS